MSAINNHLMVHRVNPPLAVALALAIAAIAAAPSAPAAQPPSAASTPADANETPRYTVTLATDFTPPSDAAAKKEYPGRTVYVTRVSVVGHRLYLLRVGFFATRAEAAAIQKQSLRRYPGAWVATATEQEFSTATGRPTRVIPPGDAERQAERLMAEGRAAIIQENYPAAIAAFERLLALPETPQHQDAQEFFGLAHERRGNNTEARRVYERYLARYPEGDDARRVRQRLANLSAARETPPPPLRAPVAREVSQTLIYGGLSQYYYRGNSKIETQTTTANTLDRATLSLTDQSALITDLSLNARLRGATFDDRVVFRETYTSNFLAGQKDINRLTAAYYEHRSKPDDWSARLGRQPGNSGGILGRFDGAAFGMGIAPKWRVNAVAGAPVEITSIDSKRSFYGLNIDFGLFAEHWGGNLYAFRQTVDDIPDRQALGMELRYTSSRATMFSLVDYDTLFGEVNVAMVQGNWQSAANTSYNVLLDRRKTPTLQTTTAIMGEATTSIATLLQTYSEEELRARAQALTATSNLISAGLTHPINSTWQLGGDVQLSRISGTDGTTNLPATPDTGNIYTYTFRAIGTGLFAARDVTLFAGSLIRADSYDGVSFALTNRSLVGPRWIVEPNARWYQQDGPLDTKLTRITPALRVSYRWKETLTFEGELGLERTETQNATTDETSDRRFFSLGYRWDF